MKRYNLLSVNHPFVEVECNGETKKTEPVVNEKKNPMFPNPILIMDVVSQLVLLFVKVILIMFTVQ